MTEKKKTNALWPDVSTVETAKTATRHGFGAAVLVAVLTAAVGTWSLLSKEAVLGYIDAWVYVDAVLFSAVAFGIYRESRFAAIAGLALFVLEKVYQVQVTGTFDGAVLAVFLTLFFISSVRGTFALRRLRNAAGGQTDAQPDGPGPSSPPQS